MKPRIAIDTMGGDGGISVSVPGALACLDLAEFTLVGDIEQIARQYPDAQSQCTLVHADSVLNPNADLGTILRASSDTSLCQTLDLLSSGQVDGVASSADTLALMALARKSLKMLPGMKRPAIAKKIAGKEDAFWLLDLGANIECTVTQLAQFATMGIIAATHLDGHESPRLALLNIGTEKHKGPKLLHTADELFASEFADNYVGFLEGNRLFDGVADVVVCDGFVGNVALKAMEGTAGMAKDLLKKQLAQAKGWQKLGFWLARDNLRDLDATLNPQYYNGASLFGLNGVVVKSHGTATVRGFSSALRQVVYEVSAQIPSLIGDQIQHEG